MTACRGTNVCSAEVDLWRCNHYLVQQILVTGDLGLLDLGLGLLVLAFNLGCLHTRGLRLAKVPSSNRIPLQVPITRIPSQGSHHISNALMISASPSFSPEGKADPLSAITEEGFTVITVSY